MQISLAGYTGFVGSNIYNQGQAKINGLYTSKNIENAYGTAPDILIYAGLRAEKYLANMYPEKDKLLIEEAKKNITAINPKKLVLISTIDVFKDPKNVDENTVVDTENLQPYGYNRYALETWVRENYPDALITRLPALFGKNIKKNFLYDYLNLIPQMLKKEKMQELIEKDAKFKDYYELSNAEFYKVKELDQNEKIELKEVLDKVGFSSLNFTDSRSYYQFYNLANLWNDLKMALKHNILLWHPATEPVSASEIYKYLTGKDFINEITDSPSKYNCKTIYSELFGGKNGYICNKDIILKQIKDFVSCQEGL